MSEEMVTVNMTVNGEAVTKTIPVRTHLVDFIRTELGFTGSHLGCEHGICGACSVRVDGDVVRGCLMLAAQAEGAEVLTIEGITDTGEIADLQDKFVERNALQCGFCTPGMLMTAAELLAQKTEMSREDIREFMSGNYCRCTGYHAIVDAIEAGFNAHRQKTCGSEEERRVEPHLKERPAQISGHRRMDNQALTAPRVGQGDLNGVERQAP